MKGMTNEKGQALILRDSDITAAVLIHICMALLGFVSCRAVIFSKLVPFGVSMLAAVSAECLPSAAIGVFLGYFIPAVGGGAFRYIAAMLAVLAIRLIISAYKKIAGNVLFLCFITAAALGITATVSAGISGAGAAALTAEVLLGAAATYFFRKAFTAVSHRNMGFSADELACLLLTLGLWLLGIYRFKIYGLSIGASAGVLLVLIAAKYGGILAGASAGISLAFSFALLGGREEYFSFAFAGLAAGVFYLYGKPTQAVSVTAVGIITVAARGLGKSSAAFMVEIIIAGIMFLILPRSAGAVLGKFFSIYPKVTVQSDVKNALQIKLYDASAALSDVSGTVEQVSAELARIDSPDYSCLLSNIEQEACGGCKLRMHCWENRREETLAAVLSMTDAVKANNLHPENFVSEEFRLRCMRPQQMGDAVVRRYTDYASRISAARRVEQVRSVISEQFNGLSKMLERLGKDLSEKEKFDTVMAESAAAALKNLNIRAQEAICRIDKFGRATVQIKAKNDPDTVINKMQIMKVLSLACEKDFDVPSVTRTGSDLFISLSQHAAYRVNVGVHQICASGSSMCGDAYNFFADGRGHFIIVLSDGMGTGGRAAVDGAMACGLMARMLKGGFEYDCALQILNSSMLFKSTEESLATVDISSIDLFTGETEICKAGAAPTVVRRSGRTGKAEGTSLPVGILQDVKFDRASIRLKDRDILLMMSDGATGSGIDWIRNELEMWQDSNADDLAEKIARSARRRRNDSHEDDITVIAAIIEKAP